MSNTPSVSVRRWIKWEKEESKEPTFTLVLTSPKSNFIDIRILAPLEGPQSRECNLLKSTNEVIENCSMPLGILHTSQLDWAFAGSSFRMETAAPDSTARGVWRHWVDSRYLEAESVVDEGDLFPVYDGDEELELEKGSMSHPLTGRMTAYEELWASGTAFSAGEGSSTARMCLVLRTSAEKITATGEDQGLLTRGMIIRVGHWVQGIIRRANNFIVERWIWIDDSKSDSIALASGERVLKHGNGTWRQLIKVQHLEATEQALSLPCELTMASANMLVEGRALKAGNVHWEVEEVVSW